MSGEIDMRLFSGRPSDKPKYLSDSLTSFYGHWEVTGGGPPYLEHTDLPPLGDCIAKVTTTHDSARDVDFYFSMPQNLRGYLIDFYVKVNVSTNLWVVLFKYNTFIYIAKYNVPLSIGNWVRNVLSVDSFVPKQGSDSLQWRYCTLVARRVNIVDFFFIGHSTPCKMEISGFTIRRP